MSFLSLFILFVVLLLLFSGRGMGTIILISLLGAWLFEGFSIGPAGGFSMEGFMKNPLQSMYSPCIECRGPVSPKSVVKDIEGNNKLHDEIALTCAPPDPAGETVSDTSHTTYYGADYDIWNSYRDAMRTEDSCYGPTCLPVLSNCGERRCGIDEANTRMAADRERSRRCMDGWALKDANYYKYHYGPEFSDCEDREWWGRSEY